MPADQEDPGNDIPSRCPPVSTVLLSGGLDSAAALASIVACGGPTSSLFIDYGQPPALEERAAARAIAGNYDLTLREVTVDGFDVSSGEITGRNAMLVVLALMAGADVGTLVLGVHRGSDYWDCGPEFLTLMQSLLDGYSAGRVQLLAPFADLGKGDVYRYGRALAVPENLTYSCEAPAGPCGACLSCRDVEANARP